MMDECTDQKLAQWSAKLDVSYGPLTGRQWVNLSRTVFEHDEVLLEFTELTDHFTVPILDLLEVSAEEFRALRMQNLETWARAGHPCAIAAFAKAT